MDICDSVGKVINIHPPPQGGREKKRERERNKSYIFILNDIRHVEGRRARMKKKRKVKR